MDTYFSLVIFKGNASKRLRHNLKKALLTHNPGFACESQCAERPTVRPFLEKLTLHTCLRGSYSQTSLLSANTDKTRGSKQKRDVNVPSAKGLFKKNLLSLLWLLSLSFIEIPRAMLPVFGCGLFQYCNSQQTGEITSLTLNTTAPTSSSIS